MKDKTILNNLFYSLYDSISFIRTAFMCMQKNSTLVINMTRSLITVLFIALAPTYAQALPEDANKPIDVSANSASLDDKQGLTILTGAVKIVQGTMTMTADKLTIYRNKQGDIEKMKAVGKPAFFTQQQEKSQPYSKAWGTNMLYSVSNQTVTITGNARVEQLKDKFSGEKIVYHMDKAIVKATGGNQRVKMVIQPKGKK